MATSLKVIRPNRLSDDETLTSFEDWKNNIIFYLNQDTTFGNFLKETTTWNKTAENDEHRGLDSADTRKSLERFLGLIASLAPPLLYHEIIDDTTKIADVFRLLRNYYQFSPSESTFIKFLCIKREVKNGSPERPLHLYLRMRQFIRDNLLLSSGKIMHDGKVPTTNEVLSPTTERLIVLRWLEILHSSLPSYVANIFYQDLQTKSLKDLQPRICEQMDDLLYQVESKNEEQSLSAAYTKVGSRSNNHYNKRNPFGESYNSSKFQTNFQKPHANTFPRSGPPNNKSKFKTCAVCRSLNIPFVGHDIQTCPNVVPTDRSSVLKSFALEVDDVVDDQYDENHACAVTFENEEFETVDVQRVGIARSPEFNVRINKVMVSAVLDTGATGSMIQLDICEQANIKVYPTSHKAVQADGYSHLKVVGEIHTKIVVDDGIQLPLSALVVTSLKQSLIIGMAFMMEHQLTIDIGNNSLIVRDCRIPFNHVPGNPKVSLLRVDINCVVFPGDSVSVPVPANFIKDSEVAIESRDDPSWPAPCIISTKDGFMDIPNNTDKPVKVRANQVIGQIRSVIAQPDVQYSIEKQSSKVANKSTLQHCSQVDSIKLDPDNILTDVQKKKFIAANNEYSSVFSSKIGSYNGKSGDIFGDVILGKNIPMPKKGKVPVYCSKKSALLQEKFDELVDLGVLKRPEEVGVTVAHTSPSFLVNNPSTDSHRLVTSFVELNKFVCTLPAKLSTAQDVFTAIAKWKYIIKTDMKSAYYQIKIKDGVQKWLGTVSPYKGVYVYDKGSPGLKNMAEILEELISRVMGDLVAQGKMAKIADDFFVGGSTVENALENWIECLQRLKENNLTLSANKTVICPTTTKIVGWIWKNGKLEADPHKTNPLTVCKQPENVKQMRSFLGAFRVVTCCIPRYSVYLSELEDTVAGKDSADKITWTDKLSTAFKSAQSALKNPKTITLPNPDDQLLLVSDACNSPAAVGSTLYIKRGNKYLIGGFFSAKVKKHQLLWLPCELEALGINLSINHFSNHIRESKHCTKFLTDSKPCVQAFGILSNGGFSLSPRVSSFLMNLNSLNVSINHISGELIPLTDFCSRNPIDCEDKTCQLCQFVDEHLNIAVNEVTVDQVINGSLKMPFYNSGAWKDAQKHDADLRRVYSQLISGTRPGRKEKNLKIVRQYLQITSISQNGLLIRRKPNAFGKDYELIIVPQNLAAGLISMLHIRLGHPTKTQFRKSWDRYFFAINADDLIDQCTKTCSLCNSLKSLPKELLTQTTSQMPDAIGQMFSVDVLRREKQCILVLLDKFSSFLLAMIIPSEKNDDFRQGIVHLASPLMALDGCSVRVDNAPGFMPLKNDEFLRSIGISLDFGRVKNKNKNPTIDKAVQELEGELKRLLPDGGMTSPGTLAMAVRNTNSRVRMNGLSAREIIVKRDNFTNDPINFLDDDLKSFKYEKRVQNHLHSAVSKSRGGSSPADITLNSGDIVHIKSDGTKHRVREFYLVVDVDYDKEDVYLQKFCGSRLQTKRYVVKLQDIYKVPSLQEPAILEMNDDIDDSDVEMVIDEGDSKNDVPLRRSPRIRTQPDWLATSEIYRR